MLGDFGIITDHPTEISNRRQGEYSMNDLRRLSIDGMRIVCFSAETTMPPEL